MLPICCMTWNKRWDKQLNSGLDFSFKLYSKPPGILNKKENEANMTIETDTEKTAIYNDNQIKLQNLLGRTYYNPLGEQPFGLLRRLQAGKRNLSVLDAGCGRGQTARWWAERGAQVDAFDPSHDMLAATTDLLKQHNLSEQVRLQQAKIDNFVPDRQYDLIIAHDVLCYSAGIADDLHRLVSWTKPAGIISISGYSCDASTPAARRAINAWGITQPPGYAAITELLDNTPATVLLHNDTSRQYRSHWTKMRVKLDNNRDEVSNLAGAAEAAAFSNRVDAILAAVIEGNFGHWWSVLELPGK